MTNREFAFVSEIGLDEDEILLIENQLHDEARKRFGDRAEYNIEHYQISVVVTAWMMPE